MKSRDFGIVTNSEYRDRAAERRLQEDVNASSSVSERTKGLDLSLLALQRQGIRAMDLVVSVDAGSKGHNKYKLLEQKISELFPPIPPYTGWQFDIGYSLTSRPPKRLDFPNGDLNTREAVRNAVLVEQDAKIVSEAFRRSTITPAIVKRLKSREDEENSTALYSREIQELSDEEEEEESHARMTSAGIDQHPPRQVRPAINVNPPGEEIREDSDDDDFELFPETNGSYAPTRAPSTPPVNNQSVEIPVSEPRLEVDFLSLTVAELRSFLERVDSAIRILQPTAEARM